MFKVQVNYGQGWGFAGEGYLTLETAKLALKHMKKTHGVAGNPGKWRIVEIKN